MARMAMPTAEQARDLQAAIRRQAELRDQIAADVDRPAGELRKLTGAYLDATDAMFEAQQGVARGFACSR